MYTQVFAIGRLFSRIHCTCSNRKVQGTSSVPFLEFPCSRVTESRDYMLLLINLASLKNCCIEGAFKKYKFFI